MKYTKTNDHGLANSNWNGVFSVDKNDKELISQLKKASETYNENGKQKVKIYYHTYMFVNPTKYSSRTVITKMEIINEQNPTEKGKPFS